MRVEVVEVRDGLLTGRLDYEPFGDVVVKRDDSVVFGPRYVIAVWED